jgi:hypothetical protein
MGLACPACGKTRRVRCPPSNSPNSQAYSQRPPRTSAKKARSPAPRRCGCLIAKRFGESRSLRPL